MGNVMELSALRLSIATSYMYIRSMHRLVLDLVLKDHPGKLLFETD